MPCRWHEIERSRNTEMFWISETSDGISSTFQFLQLFDEKTNRTISAGALAFLHCMSLYLILKTTLGSFYSQPQNNSCIPTSMFSNKWKTERAYEQYFLPKVTEDRTDHSRGFPWEQIDFFEPCEGRNRKRASNCYKGQCSKSKFLPRAPARRLRRLLTGPGRNTTQRWNILQIIITIFQTCVHCEITVRDDAATFLPF